MTLVVFNNQEQEVIKIHCTHTYTPLFPTVKEPFRLCNFLHLLTKQTSKHSTRAQLKIKGLNECFCRNECILNDLFLPQCIYLALTNVSYPPCLAWLLLFTFLLLSSCKPVFVTLQKNGYNCPYIHEQSKLYMIG